MLKHLPLRSTLGHDETRQVKLIGGWKVNPLKSSDNKNLLVTDPCSSSAEFRAGTALYIGITTW